MRGVTALVLVVGAGVGTAVQGPLDVADGAFVPSSSTASGGVELVVARTDLDSAMDGVDSLITMAQGQVPADLVATLSHTLASARAARAGDDPAAMATAQSALVAAQSAVVAARAQWSTARQQQAAAADAQRVRQAADDVAQKTSAAPQATAEPAPVPAPETTSASPDPAPVEAPEQAPDAAPAASAPTPSGAAADAESDATAYLMSDLAGAGATGVTISYDWAAVCKQPDSGPGYIQGCATTAAPTVVYMKALSAQLAATQTARGVVLHEYAHLLQYRIGYVAVRDATDAVFGAGQGIEQSADCMAIAMGATGAPGGYTSDCSGRRGTLAAALLAGRLS